MALKLLAVTCFTLIPFTLVSGQVARDNLPGCAWTPTVSDPGTCKLNMPPTSTTASVPSVTASPTRDPAVSCSMHNADPDQGIDRGYCVCSSSSSTLTAPFISIASPTIYTQSCDYSTWPATTTSASIDLPPATTNTRACQVCTPYAINEDNCVSIPNCTPQVAVATVTVGSEPVHVGTLTGTALYTSVSNALRSLCPDATQTTTSTQCNPTGEVSIPGIDYVSPGDSLEQGSLLIKVPTSGYNQSSLRDAMISSIAMSAQTSATGSNCFNVSYEVETFKRRSVFENLLPASVNDWILSPRDRPHPVVEHMTMCNAAWFHTTNYYNPFWRSAPLPGPSDYINAVVTFHVSNSDIFLCEFLDLLVDGLMYIAPEFVAQDVALEEGIDALCNEKDGGALLRSFVPH